MGQKFNTRVIPTHVVPVELCKASDSLRGFAFSQPAVNEKGYHPLDGGD